MPLLNGKRFVKKQPPKNLSLSEELFFCPTTLEVFRDYDEYFERTILINSLTWQCSICGRGPSNYAAAALCERADCRQLNSFCPSLTAGLLYIIFQVKLKKLSELVEILCGFTFTRFFVGEPVEYSTYNSNTYHLGTIKDLVETVTPKRNRGARANSPSKIEGGTSGADPSKSLAKLSTGFPDSSRLLYWVKEDKALDDSKATTKRIPQTVDSDYVQLLPGTNIQRRSQNVLTRDRIKFFIRHTCELKEGCFTPKVSILRRYGLFPYGPITWSTLFPLCEPQWTDLSKPPIPSNLRCDVNKAYKMVGTNNPGVDSYRVIDTFNNKNKTIAPGPSNSRKQQFPRSLNAPLSLNFPEAPNCVGYLLNDLDHSRTIGISAPPHHSQSLSTQQNKAKTLQRLERYERLELEREWSLIRRHEDLELSDLAPLPEYQQFPTQLPSEDLGSAIQLFEFFHIFGDHLKLFIPHEHWQPASGDGSVQSFPNRSSSGSAHRLSWSVFESALLDSDPCGVPVEMFISLLCAIRKLEMDMNSRQVPPSVFTATYMAGAAVALAECHTAEHILELQRMIQGLDVDQATDVMVGAACAARFNELVGIPTSAASGAAGRAAAAAAAVPSVEETHGTTECGKEECSPAAIPAALQSNPTINRDSQSRATTMAIIAGATALCPLDRVGVSEALFLHIVTAVARGGGWRAPVWGGTRLMDDPAVTLARENPDLLMKLRKTSICRLSAHERLILLTCLMDQILLYPQMREQLEDRFEHVRVLRARLRSVRADRGQAEENASAPDVQAKNRARHGRPRGRPPLNKNVIPTKVEAEMSSEPLDSTNVSKCENEELAKAQDNLLAPVTSWSEERKLRNAIVETSRACSMLPLGQDRFFRRYWLLMSIPAILVEDAPSDDIPMSLNPQILTQQISSLYPDLAEKMGLASVENAVLRLRKLSERLPDHGEEDRDDLTDEMALQILRPKTSVSVNLDQLRCLVKRQHVVSPSARNQKNCPVLAQLRKLRPQPLTKHPYPVVWSILTPFSGTLPRCAYKTDIGESSGPDAKPNTIQNEAKAPSVPENGLTPRATSGQPTTESHELRAQIEGKIIQSDRTLKPSDYGTEINSDGSTPSSDPVESRTITNLKTEEKSRDPCSKDLPGDSEACSPSVIDRATWTIDSLEASLNPRGVREAQLRRTIGNLRPLLIQVVAQCPTRFVNPTVNSECLSPEKENSHSAESGLRTSPQNAFDADEVLFKWLQITLDRLAERLGQKDVIRAQSPQISESNKLQTIPESQTLPNASSGLTQSSSLVSSGDPHFVSPNNQELPNEATPAHPSLPDQARKEPEGLPSCNKTRQKRLKLISDTLLAIANAVGSKNVAGPISEETKTLRKSEWYMHLANQSDNGTESDCNDTTSKDSVPPPSLPPRITGWQRWCLHVTHPESFAQLHLLARALERCARRAVTGCRKVPASVAAEPSKRFLTRLRCTACRGRADTIASTTPIQQIAVSSGSSGDYIPFSVCSGCASPFHLDCLLCDTARARRLSLRQKKRPRQWDPSKSPLLAGMTEMDVRMTGYWSLQSSLSNMTAARGESIHGSLFLCNTCLRAADRLPSGSELSTQTIVTETKSITESSSDSASESDTESEATSKTSADVRVGRSRRGSSSSLSDGRSRRGRSQRLIQLVSTKKRRPGILESERRYQRLSKKRRTGSAVQNRLHRLHKNSLNPVRTRPKLSGQRVVFRSKKTTKVKRHPPPSKTRDQTSARVPKCSTIPKEKSGEDPASDQSDLFKLLQSDGVLKIDLPELTFLKNASVVLDSMDGDGSLVHTDSHKVDKPPCPDFVPPPSPSPSPVLDQKAAERLLADLCSTQSARPLLRCGLGRTLATGYSGGGEISSAHHSPASSSSSCSDQRTSSRRSLRTARCSDAELWSVPTEDHFLYAWDLCGLQDLLSRRVLPFGPEQLVGQLRLLFKHWLNSNRPGSRLYQCAEDLSHLFESKLAQLRHANSSTELLPTESPDTLPTEKRRRIV
ncbi:unnamed protein product [Calicophoron daubneyi]|uniref:WAC domain-containing protein n=1 Tax=Calicophoron daubneyi TaxID=300641 RepID=A0AAV2T4T4_CALDB